MIGEKIRQLIESQSNYTKKEVAEKIQTSETNLQLLMKRESVETKYLESLCKIFGVPMTFFFDENTPTSKKASPESRKFGDDVLEFLKEQLRQKDAQIMELIQRVGKGEGVGYFTAGLLPVFFYRWVTKRLTPLA